LAQRIGIITPAKGGLGTTLVKALAQELDAEVEVVSGPGWRESPRLNGMANADGLAAFLWLGRESCKAPFSSGSSDQRLGRPGR
jgi:hypothetical protein